MASAWGGSWGAAWGNAWGTIAEPTQQQQATYGGGGWWARPPRRRKRDDERDETAESIESIQPVIVTPAVPDYTHQVRSIGALLADIQRERQRAAQWQQAMQAAKQAEYQRLLALYQSSMALIAAQQALIKRMDEDDIEALLLSM